MANLSIKDVPEHLAETLRQRAMRNHRSLQGELMSLVESAVSTPSADRGNSTALIPAEDSKSRSSLTGPEVVGFDRLGRAVTRRGSKTIEQIYAEHLERFPEPFTQGPMSADIIRQDRDSR